ncbi:MAG: chloride channel protein [Planctomycetota bacterium]
MRSIPLRRLRRLGLRLGFQRSWYLVTVAAVMGLIMSGVAIAFIEPLRRIERWLEHADRGTLWWMVPVVPVVGALLAGVVIHLMPSIVRGPGVTAVMFAIHRRKSRMPPRLAVRKWLASTLTIGSGGSAGAEGPIVTIGSVIGSNLGRLLRANSQDTATLLGCGAAAGLASVFNAPFAGIFFVMEILLRDFSLRTFTPIVIAAVISAVTTQALTGSDPIFATAADFAPTTFNPAELPNYLLLGVVCGLVAAAFIRGLSLSESLFTRVRVHPILKPALGATALGAIGLAWLLLIDSPSLMPPFYGNGYPAIRHWLDPGNYGQPGGLGPATPLLLVLVVLGVFKAVATCLTIGSGGAGGMFAPSLLMGACVGGAFGTVVESLGWFPSASPAHYALVGMAGVVAAATHAPLTAILIVYEITRSYEIMLPLMFAAVISTVVVRLVHRESVYTVHLTRLGVRIGGMSDLTILRRLAVADVPLKAPTTVHADDSVQRLVELSESRQVGDFVVVDDRGHYAGLVTGADLHAALVHREAIPLLQVGELQRSDLPTVTTDETLDVVLDKFARHDVMSLAVLDEHGDGTIRGLITRERLMRRYQDALDRD